VRTTRFYEQASLLPAPERTPSGYRIYAEDAITRRRIGRSTQALGLSLAEIADMLRVRDADGPVGARNSAHVPDMLLHR
jgi:DNA-binding transcriptional MerR regulator